MGKGKGERGGRGGRHGGCRGHKPSFFDPTLDTEMVDAPNRRSERSKKNHTRSSVVHMQHEHSKRGRVGKAARSGSWMQPSVFDNVPYSQQLSTRADRPIPVSFAQDPFDHSSGAAKSCRASIGTCISALSTQGGRGLYCYKCARTNRKLRQALFDLLERAHKDGKKLIDEWAWEAGVSPDHMDCERTKMRAIPEEPQREHEPCHTCKAEMLRRNQSHHMDMSPSQTLQLSGMPSPRPPPAGPYQTEFSQPQQKYKPFVQVVPGAFERQPSPMLASQAPNTRPWSEPNTISVADQAAMYARYAGCPSQASRSQAQHDSHRQQQQAANNGHFWQIADGHHNDSTHGQRPDQECQQLAVNHIVEQPLSDLCILDPIGQENPCAKPYLSAQHISSVEGGPCVQLPQAPQHPFQHLQDLSGTMFADTTVSSHEEDQYIPMAAQGYQGAVPNAPITPPASNEMTIPGMLNTASEALSAQNEEPYVRAEARSEALHQGLMTARLGDLLDPGPGQGQQPPPPPPPPQQLVNS